MKKMKKMKPRTLFNILILLIVGIACFTLGLLFRQSQKPYDYEFELELLNAYDQYYDKTEALLDSIYSSGVMKEDTFTNVVMETNTYYEYEVTRDRVDSLYLSQL